MTEENKKQQGPQCLGTGKIVYGSDTETGRESVACVHEKQREATYGRVERR